MEIHSHILRRAYGRKMSRFIASEREWINTALKESVTNKVRTVKNKLRKEHDENLNELLSGQRESCMKLESHTLKKLKETLQQRIRNREIRLKRLQDEIKQTQAKFI